MSPWKPAARAPEPWADDSDLGPEAQPATVRMIMHRNRLLHAGVGRSALATVALATALVLVTGPSASLAVEAMWLSAVVVVALVRVSWKRRYAERADDPEEAVGLDHLFTVGAAMSGALWGLAAVFLFPPDLVGRVFMGFVFAGVSAGAITSLGPSSFAAITFLALTLLPLAVRLLLVGELVTMVMGGMTLLFLTYLRASGNQMAEVLEENLRLRLTVQAREGSLRRERDLLERVGRMAAVGGWSIDAETERLEWSPQVYRIHGVDPNTRPSLEDALRPYPEGTRAEMEIALQGALRSGERYDLEVPFIRPSGEHRWMRAQGEPEIVDGRIVGLTGTIQDVTERKLAEEALRTDLRALERLHETISDAALSLDDKIERLLDLGIEVLGLDDGVLSRIEGQMLTVRAARGLDPPARGSAFDLADTYSSITLVGEAPASFHHVGATSLREHPAYWRTRVEAYLGSAITVDGEPYGTMSFSSLLPRPRPFSDNERVLVRIFSEWIGFELSRERNLAKRRDYQRRLASSLAMQRAVLDSTSYAIVATDVRGTIRTFSRGAERMLGYAAAEMEERTSPVVLHDPAEMKIRASELSTRLGRKILPDFDLLVALAESSDGIDEREWTYLRRDGTRFPALVSITAMRNERSELLGYVEVAADLTERKRVDLLKNEFVSTVSHELRSPLTSIHGALGLVSSGAAGELPPRIQELVQVATRNSERLILLINDLLDMEKIESGRVEVVLRAQGLSALVEQAVQANRTFAGKHGVDIATDTDGDPWVEVDENRMIQVLTNLISNAAKFSPEGETVRVVVTATDEVARVAVVDRGPGIPEAFRPRIFEKFTQADASDRRAKGGTGLGLSITRALVTKMGGEIGFESEVGSGTTFWVAFPRVR